MDLPFNKIIVDRRHASAGTSSNFEISQSTFLLDSIPVFFLFFVLLSLDFPTLLTFHHFFLDLSDPLDVLDICKLDFIITLLAIEGFF